MTRCALRFTWRNSFAMESMVADREFFLGLCTRKIEHDNLVSCMQFAFSCIEYPSDLNQLEECVYSKHVRL